MKNFLFSLLFLVIASVASYGQLIANLSVNQPSATLSEWSLSNTAITYIVENRSAGGSRTVIIKSTLKTTDGTVVATTDLAKATAITLTPGTRIFFAKDVFPLEVMIFTPSFRSTLEKTGKLPSGTYLLEVQLVSPGSFAELSGVQSRMFNLSAPQLPYLITPVDRDSLPARRAETGIIFRWTPLIPRPQEQPYYRLQVFEILEYQQPLQALRANQPVLDHLLRGQTQYIWRPQILFSTDTTRRRFIWTIQTLNRNQQPYIQTSGNGESRSEPFVFYIADAGKRR